ncbi:MULTISPECIES: hypothetical protein [Stenotrophomonas]|uniref:hypothetical protein n=1 Tax=Stenotrophomonas TaxID=40323 RepID=UPI0008728EA1|nr:MULTISPECIES: hypothetical protein [Stenotrophomonas]OEZ00669.1 hypothetical protein BIY45_10370 [Stenotrophomonas sp. BIIR7]
MIRDFFSTCLQRRLRQGLCAFALIAGVGSAHGADIHISAEFKPDISDPDKREFTNTTPWSGVCNSGHLQSCINNEWWSIDTKIRGTKDAIAQANYGRNGFFIGMPAPRVVQVTSDDGAHTFDLRLNIIGAAMRLTDLEQDGPPEPGPVAPRNCDLGLKNAGAGNYSVMRMFLRRDGGEGVAECALQYMQTNNYAMQEFDFTYKLITPAPLGMPSGIYTGTTTYRIGGTGEGADFDLGNGVTLEDNIINVHFSLTVQHAFQLDLPPGSDRAVLMPRGGWTQWSDYGIVPKSLEREVPFSVSSSGQFEVSLQCQHPTADGRCAIRNMTDTAHEVPLDIRLTMPGFRDAASGLDAVDMSLTTTMVPPVFTADTFIIRRPSKLHFGVHGEAVSEMLDNPGSHYRGDVTVIFDAAP